MLGFCDWVLDSVRFMMINIGVWPVLVLFICFVLVPAVVSVGVWWLHRQHLKWLLWAQLGFTTLFLASCWVFSQNSVLLQGDALTLNAGIYNTQVPAMSASNNKLAVVPASELGDFTPATAVDGIHLPRYQVGWFRLANNELAFVMLIGEVAQVSIVRTQQQMVLVGGDLTNLALASY